MWGPLDAALKDLNSREGARSTRGRRWYFRNFICWQSARFSKKGGREESRSEHEAVMSERPYLQSAAGGKQGP